MNDRLDDALEGLARVYAPADFATRVRVRLEQETGQPSLRPRLAAVAAAVLLLVAGLWMAVSVDRGREDRMADAVVGGSLVGGANQPPPRLRRSAEASAKAEAPPAQVTRPVQGTGSTVEPHASVHPDVRAGGASAPRTRDSVSPADHDRALPALAQPGAIGPESLVSIPVRVDAREVGALAQIAPIEFPALGADEGERR